MSEECQAGQFSTSGRDLGLTCHLKFAAGNPPFSFVCRVHERYPKPIWPLISWRSASDLLMTIATWKDCWKAWVKAQSEVVFDQVKGARQVQVFQIPDGRSGFFTLSRFHHESEFHRLSAS